jgi:hypothetical protein
MRFITRMFKDWLDPLPPVAQGPAGVKVDSDFAPPEPGFWQTLLALGSDGRIYEMGPADRKRLQRPIILRDPRAVRNEEIVAAARQRRARGENAAPITIIGGREYEPALPEAEILPPVPRPVQDWVEWDDIAMPPRGAGDGGHDK